VLFRSWNNSGKVIISVHRESKEANHADVKILKVKPRIVGKWGFFAINFDVGLSRYYDISNEMGGTKVYAKKDMPKQILKPNIDFSAPITNNNEDPF
jgi:hypothetical protein